MCKCVSVCVCCGMWREHKCKQEKKTRKDCRAYAALGARRPFLHGLVAKILAIVCVLYMQDRTFTTVDSV